MRDHLTELRHFMDLSKTTIVRESVSMNEINPASPEINVASDVDTILEDLEMLRFKLLNHRQMTGSEDYALGYEEACIKVVEMIDGIIRNNKA
jgi:hypothetical protein